MKNFDLDLKDKAGTPVLEGSILGILTTRRKGYKEDGKLIQKKVVFGRANPDLNSLTEYMGFWAVSLDCKDSAESGVNYYDSVTSVEYLVKSNGAEVIGSVNTES